MVALFLKNNFSKWMNRFRTNSQKTELGEWVYPALGNARFSHMLTNKFN